MIVKPAPGTRSALALVNLAHEAGLPPGVLQTQRPAAELSRHPLASPPSATELYRLDRKRCAQPAQGHPRGGMGATPPSSSTMPSSTPPSRAPWRQNSPPAGRIASPPTASMCRPACELRRPLRFERVAALWVGHGSTDTQIGPMTWPRSSPCRRPCRRRAGARRPSRRRAKIPAGGCFSPPPSCSTGDRRHAGGPRGAGRWPPSSLQRRRSWRAPMPATWACRLCLYRRSAAGAASDQLEYGMVGVNTAAFTGAPIPFGAGAIRPRARGSAGRHAGIHGTEIRLLWRSCRLELEMTVSAELAQMDRDAVLHPSPPRRLCRGPHGRRHLRRDGIGHSHPRQRGRS